MDNDKDEIKIYQITISGTLDECWVGWFNQMQITTDTIENGNPITVLTGPLVDQVALRGLLIKIWDLNMELISVQRKEESTQDLGECPDETDD